MYLHCLSPSFQLVFSLHSLSKSCPSSYIIIIAIHTCTFCYFFVHWFRADHLGSNTVSDASSMKKVILPPSVNIHFL